MAKHGSCKCKCKFDKCKCSSNQKWNNDNCQCECKNPRKHHMCKEDYISSPSTCTCEIGKYLESMVGLVITCNEISEATKTIPTKTFPIKTISTKTVPKGFKSKL